MTATSPWLLALFSVLALVFLGIFLFRLRSLRWNTIWLPGRTPNNTFSILLPLLGAGAAFALVVFGIFFAPTAGEIVPLPSEVDRMTEIRKNTPPPPTREESERNTAAERRETFGETSKSLEEHRQETDDYIDKALNKAKERENHDR